MLTDDEVLTRLHGSLQGSVAQLTPAPALLSGVRAAHTKAARRQRLLVLAGLAVLGLGISGAVVVYPEGARAPAVQVAAPPAQDPASSPRVGEERPADGLLFRFPEGFSSQPTPSRTLPPGTLLAVRGNQEIHVHVQQSPGGALTFEQTLQLEVAQHPSHSVTKTTVAGRQGYVVTPIVSATGEDRLLTRLRLYLSPSQFLEIRGVGGVTLETLRTVAADALA